MPAPLAGILLLLCYRRVSVTCWLCVNPPPVAVIVNVNVPVGVLWLVFTVNVAKPDPVIDEGLKLALARRGNPLTLSPTGLVNPVPGEIVTV